ncbi:hypothetical protein ACFE04_015863 [Oxalis oulophora]
MVGTDRPQFVLFGSSIVEFSFCSEGWGASLAQFYARKADIVLRGYGGWNSRRALQVLDKVFPKDAATQPALVIVYFGGNDSMRSEPSGLGPHVPLPEFIDNMKKIALHLKGLSNKTQVIFLSTPPINEKKVLEIAGDIGRTNELCRTYSEACLDLCKQVGVKAIDLNTAMQQRDNWMNACFVDGVHLSSEGSKVVFREILKVLRDAEWEPSLYWKSMPKEFADILVYNIGPDGKATLATDDREINFYMALEGNL